MKRTEWITVISYPRASANQGPRYVDPLFEDFQKAGWRVVSVTVLPPDSPIHMCTAIGVLQRDVWDPEGFDEEEVPPPAPPKLQKVQKPAPRRGWLRRLFTSTDSYWPY